MVMPLYDHSPFKWPTPPYVTWLLIIVNFVIFFVEAGSGPTTMNEVDYVAGLIPAVFTAQWSLSLGILTPLTLITYTFLHANFWHVFGNMIFLWVFGDDVEEAMGHWRFLVFYLLCGIGSGLAFVFSDANSNMELVGASGAIAGVIAAYLIFRPCAKVFVLLIAIPLRLRSFWVIGGWAILQVYDVATRVQDGTAYWAHVGGLITGGILFVLMRPDGVPLFECLDEAPVPVGRALPPPLPPPLPR